MIWNHICCFFTLIVNLFWMELELELELGSIPTKYEAFVLARNYFIIIAVAIVFGCLSKSNKRVELVDIINML